MSGPPPPIPHRSVMAVKAREEPSHRPTFCAGAATGRRTAERAHAQGPPRRRRRAGVALAAQARSAAFCGLYACARVGGAGWPRRMRGGVPAQLAAFGGGAHAQRRRCQFRLFVREVDPARSRRRRPLPPRSAARGRSRRPGHGQGLRSPLQAAHHRRQR